MLNEIFFHSFPHSFITVQFFTWYSNFNHGPWPRKSCATWHIMPSVSTVWLGIKQYFILAQTYHWYLCRQHYFYSIYMATLSSKWFYATNNLKNHQGTQNKYITSSQDKTTNNHQHNHLWALTNILIPMPGTRHVQQLVCHSTCDLPSKLDETMTHAKDFSICKSL